MEDVEAVTTMRGRRKNKTLRWAVYRPDTMHICRENFHSYKRALIYVAHLRQRKIFAKIGEYEEGRIEESMTLWVLKS